MQRCHLGLQGVQGGVGRPAAAAGGGLLGQDGKVEGGRGGSVPLPGFHKVSVVGRNSIWTKSYLIN